MPNLDDEGRRTPAFAVFVTQGCQFHGQPSK
jgi:hypothetical protein